MQEYSLVEECKQVSHDHQCWPRCYGQDLTDGEGTLVQTLSSCRRHMNTQDHKQGKSDVPCAQNRQGLFYRCMKRHQLSKLPRKPEYLAPCHFPNACATISHTHLSFLHPASFTYMHIYERELTDAGDEIVELLLGEKRVVQVAEVHFQHARY